jgi:hypothetical protein
MRRAGPDIRNPLQRPLIGLIPGTINYLYNIIEGSRMRFAALVGMPTQE